MPKAQERVYPLLISKRHLKYKNVKIKKEIYETKSADLGAKLSLAKVMSLCRGGEQIVAQEKENSKCTSNEIEIRAKKGKQVFCANCRNGAI